MVQHNTVWKETVQIHLLRGISRPTIKLIKNHVECRVGRQTLLYLPIWVMRTCVCGATEGEDICRRWSCCRRYYYCCSCCWNHWDGMTSVMGRLRRLTRATCSWGSSCRRWVTGAWRRCTATSCCRCRSAWMSTLTHRHAWSVLPVWLRSNL